MISTVASACLLYVVFHFVGYLFIQKWTGKLGLFRVPVVVMSGLAVSLALGAIVYELNQTAIGYLSILSVLFLSGLGISVHRSVRGGTLRAGRWIVTAAGEKFRKGLSLIHLAVAPMTYLILLQRTGEPHSFAYRTGPDSFGWSSAILSVASGSTLESLKNKIATNFGNLDINTLFAPDSAGRVLVHRLTSFSLQAETEFLIGAHRTGIPMLEGSLISIAGRNLQAPIFVALIMITALLTSHIIFAALRIRNISVGNARWLSVIGAAGLGLISVTCEGGYGQTLMIPYFVFAVTLLANRKWDTDVVVFSFVLLIVATCATYFDALVFSIPFIGVIVAIGLIQGKFRDYIPNKFHVAMLGIAAVVSIPQLIQVPRLLTSLASNPKAGGWDQGRPFFPSDILGFTNALPFGNYEIASFGLPQFGIVFGVSAFFVAIAIATGLWKSPLFIAIFTAYAYLSYSVYSGGAPFNNYRIWKFTAYVAPLVPLLLADVLQAKPLRAASSNKHFKNLQNAATAILLIVSYSTSVFWVADWLKSREMTLDRESAIVATKLVERYDLAIADGLYGAMFLLYGDVHYASPDRGGGVVETTPGRNMVVLVKPSTKATMAILNAGVGNDHNYKSFKLLARTSRFAAYELGD